MTLQQISCPRGWRDQARRGDGSIDRRRWELGVVYELRERLRSGDVWVPYANRYSSPDTMLMSTEKFVDARSDFHRLTNTPTTAGSYLERASSDLTRLAGQLERRLGDGVEVVNGAVKVTPIRAEPDARTGQLRSSLQRLLPGVELVDLIVEVDGWCNFTADLTHAGGGAPRAANHTTLVYAAVLAQACNLGIERMAEASGLSPDRLAWVSDWYLREETLKAANTTIVNYHHSLDTAALWGTGTLSSSDGQRFPVPVKAPNAVPLSKYFGRGRGVEMYTWTSDQYSQYGVKVVPATVRDATHVLDEILDNQTDLPIAEHTTDTAGYTDLVFGLFDLLGLRFSPRIADLGHQRLYHLGPLTHAPTVAGVLKHRINTEIIAQHWDDMIHTAATPKTGEATASTLVARLQAGARRNRLAQAIQEVGRVAKTRFMLAYLEDDIYRRQINRQLNKGETLHALRSYIFYANSGEIWHRQLEEQTAQSLCLNLVTNAIVTWNTRYLGASIDHLNAANQTRPDDDLSRVSPTMRRHINPYGRFIFANHTTTELRPLRTGHPYPA